MYKKLKDLIIVYKKSVCFCYSKQGQFYRLAIAMESGNILFLL